MSENEARGGWNAWRLLILGLVVVLVVIGLVLVILTITDSSTATAAGEEEVNALANSDDECVVCHDRTTPGIVQQYGVSTMAAAEVACRDCHEVEASH
ncbi:MAG: hypothetical protein PVJ75_12005, partial [Chloroflexota bacterium]